MCRLFGLAAGQTPVPATFWLLDAPDSFTAQSHREPDGTGLGWFDDGGRPRIDKRPIAAYADRTFACEAREVRSSAFVSHIRFASTGALTVPNTHPFEQRGRLFAHNGVLQDLPALEHRLGEAMSLVGGETDSERFFALITAEVERHDGDVAQGIAAAVGWIADTLPLLSLNFVLIAPGELWALRYPDAHGLYLLERPASGAGDDEAALDGVSSHGTRVHSDAAIERPTVVVASEPMDGEDGWREFRSGELIHVDGDLTVASRIVRDQPPAHPLTLAELEGRARSSQQQG